MVTQNHVFEDTALALGDSFTLTDRLKAIKVDGIRATSSLLPMPGAKPLLGRIFLPEEDQPGKPATVVLTYGLWQREFAGDPSIVGRAITLDGHAYTVVGILSASFRVNHEVIPTVAGIDKPEFFMPPLDEAKNPTNYGSENYNILARLKPGVTMRQAQSDIDVIAARHREENSSDRDVPVYDIATMDQRVQDSMARQRFAMTMLGGFAGFAMILAAVGVYGVMSFLVTQGTADIAIRMALGARRGTILSLVFQRGMGLALVGIVAGVIGALGLTRMMNSMPFGVKPTDPFTFLSVLALLLFVALSACLFPARRAMHTDPMAALRTE